jgi:amidase
VAIEEARPIGIEQTYELFSGLFGADSGAGVRALLARYGTVEPHPWLGVPREAPPGPAPAASEAFGLLPRWDAFRATLLPFLETRDVIVCPACAQPAMPHDTWRENLPAFSYTMTHNLTGWPGAVVRAGTSPEGLPIGVQVVARAWREDVALAVARHLETAFGGWRRPPR